MKKGYKYFEERLEESDIMHLGIGLKYYTHFTSPIRRYVDLWNHYLIKSIIENKNITPAIEELGMLDFHINQKNDIYKLAYKDLDIINLYHDMENSKNSQVTDSSFIIGIQEPASLVVYLTTLNRIVNIKLINRKLEDLFATNICEGEKRLDVVRRHNDEKMAFELGQKINVKITKNSSQIRFSKRLFFEIIEPSYSSWLLE
jgi:exoribonuclease R